MISKEQLIEKIKIGDEFNIFNGDIKTYQWLRTEGQEILKDKGLGGGNLTLALIAFTQLDLLGQCYVKLSNQAKIMNSNGDIDKTDALLKMLDAIVNNWGYSTEDIKKFWNRRHMLIHQSFPQKASILVPSSENYKTLSELNYFATQNKNKPFFIDNDTVIVLPDALLESIKEIKEEIIKRLERNHFGDTQIEETLKFIIG